MADFAEGMTPRVIDFAQRIDWLGRRVLELGCGTGASQEWLIRRNYIVVGVDHSPEMLNLCRQRLDAADLYYDLRQQDIRALDASLNGMDLVLALDVMNELHGLHELEAVFRGVHNALSEGRLFVFDLHTLQGLYPAASNTAQILANQPGLMVVAADSFDHERQIHQREFDIFRRQGDLWQRDKCIRSLRGYPVQAVIALLSRCGFITRHVTHLNFEPYEPGLSQTHRVIFWAEKQ
jgi:SAM-dependent methyltransferase